MREVDHKRRSLVAAAGAFWQRLISEAGPLGRLGMRELAQLRSLLQLALAGADQPPASGQAPGGATAPR